MSKELTNIKSRYERLAIRLEDATKNLEKNREDFKVCEQDIADYKKVNQVLIDVGSSYRISSTTKIANLVTSSLQAVFGPNYEFTIVTGENRGQLETSLQVKEADLELDPETQIGGGILDVISLSLRAILWSMGKKKFYPFLALDEPARNVSESYIGAVSTIIKKLSEKLGLQFLIVTHRDGLTASAAKTFKVCKDKFSSVEGM